MLRTVKAMPGHIIKPVKMRYRRYVGRSRIAALRRSTHPRANDMATAIEQTIFGILTEEESNWISRIESRRAELMADESVVTVMDFGAGSGKENFDLERAKKGVKKQLSVAKITKASKNRMQATLLFKLIRHLKPAHCLEMGSCAGISAAYQAAGLALNGKGDIITLEGATNVAEIAKATLDGLKLNHAKVITGPFHETLDAALQEQSPIDFLFNDGHHDGQAVMNYYEAALPCLDKFSVMFLDDIRWSDSMFSAWKKLSNQPGVCISIDFGRMGMIVLDQQSRLKEQYTIRI